jgi:Pyruvate/2-oxoacid:ferredoxin oxidoreductase gamma subunit
MDPLESLRYVEYLHERGMVISAAEPFRNIDAYPDESLVLDAIRALPRHRLIETKRLAEAAGIPGGANMVLVGAATDELPLPLEFIQDALRSRLASKGQDIVEKNLAALQAGRKESLA